MRTQLRYALAVMPGLAFVLEASAGAPCPTDINGDSVVDAFDLAQVLGAWGPCEGCPSDINDDGIINPFDLGAILGSWGPCPECDSDLDCADASECTDDHCQNGFCFHPPGNCDDGNPCTMDSCDAMGELCLHVPFAPCCGNGVIEPGEQCDPPNGTTCDESCQSVICGHPLAGDCCADNETPFCDVGPCCECICNCDPFCCDVNWDQFCGGDGLDGVCGAANPNGPCAEPCAACLPDECGVDADCADGFPFCTIDTCLDGTCVHDPPDCDDGNACTIDTCDDAAGGCVNELIMSCCGNGIVEPPETCDPPDGASCDDNCQLINPACAAVAGSCCAAEGNGTPGCDDIDCCQCICAGDPFCCDTQWDEVCALQASDMDGPCPAACQECL